MQEMQMPLHPDDNFVARFFPHSQRIPNKLALKISHMEQNQCVHEEMLTFSELADEIKNYQILWKEKGWQRDDRIIVIMKPSCQLYAIVLSLLSLGMTPVFIDTGMGREKIKMAIQDANARTIISMKALLKWFWVIPPMWSLERLAIDGKGLGYQSLSKQLSSLDVDAKDHNFSIVKQSESDHGLISFTSGSTGRPKGADRTHYSLIQQHLAIKNHWPDNDSDIDSPCFPVMVLHNLSCGMTTVMPKVDLSQPANVDAEQVIAQIKSHGISRLSGAPAYIQALVDYSIQHGIFNESVTSLVVGGATVSVELARGIQQAFPNAYARIVYGSTEAEPISSIDVRDYLKKHAQHPGYLVGTPAEQVELLIANLPKETTSEQDLLKRVVSCGEVGEILVSGKHVLKHYIDNPQANAENKIKRFSSENAQADVWHRTGDTGFLDASGQLWLSGRVKDTLFVDGKGIHPYPIEQALDTIDGISRSALVNVGNTVHVFVQVSAQAGSTTFVDIQREVDTSLQKLGIMGSKLHEISHMPVDGRHNSKIDRVALRTLLQTQAA